MTFLTLYHFKHDWYSCHHKTPLVSLWRHIVERYIHIQHNSESSTILDRELNTHIMGKESSLPNTVLCDHLLLCIIGKKIYKLTGKFHHFILNYKYSLYMHARTHSHTHLFSDAESLYLLKRIWHSKGTSCIKYKHRGTHTFIPTLHAVCSNYCKQMFLLVPLITHSQ
jgi:hypothetical protein